MKLKQNVTLEIVQEKLRKELSSHIAVKSRSNPINKKVLWIEANKDSFVGIKIFLRNDELRLDTHIPSFVARMFFGGLISGIFHHGSRRDFKQKIADFLVSEFYDQ
ncbi:hypothetical protein [Lacinutrix sp.]|uniref:hypothetical protein n=1 Tax=Lacinutrix sp. TaxID=1937692 RepID=UPI00260521F0|nr:hypothetical protein [Lacinutrix sp.]MDG1714817.1 hypothetical protein [Lacinutrix sp.]